MTTEETIQHAKRYHDHLTLENKDAFKSRVLNSIEDTAVDIAPAKKIQRNKRKVIVLLGVIVLPLTGFTVGNTYFKWFGTTFDSSHTQNWGPWSQWANPRTEASEFSQPGNDYLDLSKSKSMANFPIREPSKINGWTKVLSEGIISPKEDYTTLPNNQKKLTGVTKAPLMYLDVYANSSGQRIAVTQQYQEGLSIASIQSKGIKMPVHVMSFLSVGKDATLLSGYPDSQVFFISGSWADLPSHIPLKGTYENLLIEHKEKNDTVTQIIIDEYGNVSPSVLTEFAHSYLSVFK